MARAIVRNPKVMVGKPVFEGTRITVQVVLEALAAGDSIETILEGYPALERQDVLNAVAYGAAAVALEESYEVPA